MKKNTIFTTMLIAMITIISSQTNGTVWTVNNNNQSPGQFTDMQAAIDSASVGDTIYVSGSPNDYGSITLEKRLTLIGAGYNPDSPNNYYSEVSYVYLDSLDGVSGASNSKITGFYIDGQVYGSSSEPINDVVFERNYIQSTFRPYKGHNWKLINNIIDGQIYQTDDTGDLLVLNNIFTDNNCIRGFYFNTANVLFSNNVFIHNGGTVFGDHAKDVIFTNNIFYGVSPYDSDNTFCSWSNNITYGSGNDTIYLEGTNTGGGNMIGVDPQFTDVTSFSFDYAYDFHLAAGSPGINAGTDGTDIGIYGGQYPFPSGGDIPFQTSPMPNIPQILEMNVLNNNIPINQSLQIQVKARKQD